MLLTGAIGHNKDVPFISPLQIANLAAGSAADVADQAVLVVPDVSLAFAPSAVQGSTSLRGSLPGAQLAVRQVIAVPSAAATAGATNNFDWRINHWRNGVLQGVAAWMTLSVNTTTTNNVAGTVVTANQVSTITMTSTAGIAPGSQIVIDTAGNLELVTVLSVVPTTSITAFFGKTHAANVGVFSSLAALRPQNFVSAAGGVNPAATLPAIGATGSQTVTPNAVNGLSGMYGIHVGDSLLVDTVASGKQETVVVVSVTATQFTAVYTQTHGASAPVVTAVLANQGAQASLALQAKDVLSIVRLSNNVTGLASPQTLIAMDWGLASSPMGL